MRRLVWTALLLAGCGGSGLSARDVELTVSADPSVSDTELGTVTSLDIAVTGDSAALMTYPLSRPLKRPERILVHFTAPKGTVRVSALARDAQALVVMRGASDTIDLASGSDLHSASLTMLVPAAGTHSPTGIVLAPTSFTIFTGQSLQLGAQDEMVTWSASDGGSIDASGVFTGPSAAGSYHAVATSLLYPTDHGSIDLNVLANGIARYAGTLGGRGSVDGNGSLARIDASNGAVIVGDTLYFTDGEQEIRAANIQTGDVTTLAGQTDRPQAIDGTGAGAGFAGPQALAYSGAGVLYVADANCPCIRAVDIQSRQVTTIAGKNGMYGAMDGTGAAAIFQLPQGLAFDAAKHLLYVSENVTHLLRTVDVQSGVVTTIAGMKNVAGAADGAAASATFNNPYALVLDGGLLYIHDQGNNKIRKLDLGTMMVSTLASNISSSTIGSAGAGKLALASPLRTLDVASGVPNLVINSDKQQVWDFYNAIALAPDGTMWGGSFEKLIGYDPSVGKTKVLAGYDRQWNETEGPRAIAHIDSFNSFTVRADGTIYGRDNRIFKIDVNGNITSVSGAPNAQVLQGDGNMAFGSDGALYAPDRNQNVIFRIDVDHGGAVTEFAGKAGTFGTADGVGTAARFNGPEDITADGKMLYVTDQRNDTIRAIDVTTGAVTTLAGSPGMCGYVDMPGAMARFCGPDAVVADGSGNLYVADNNAIRKVVIATGAVSPLVASNGSGFDDGPSGTAKLWAPYRLTLDPQKKYVYFSELFNDTIRRVEIATGIVSTVAGAPGKTEVVEGALPGAINNAGALHFAATGELLVAVGRENSLVQIRLP